MPRSAAEMICSTVTAPAAFARSTALALSCRVKPSPMSAATASSSSDEGSAETLPPTDSPPRSSSAEILPWSSKMMRSAVFLPTPFTAAKRLLSAVAIASDTSDGRMDERIAIAIFAPTPCTEVSFKKSPFSCGSAKPNSEMPSSFTCR